MKFLFECILLGIWNENLVFFICWFCVKNCILERVAGKFFFVTGSPYTEPLAPILIPKFEVLELPLLLRSQ